jgi:hypothetical protein
VRRHHAECGGGGVCIYVEVLLLLALVLVVFFFCVLCIVFQLLPRATTAFPPFNQAGLSWNGTEQTILTEAGYQQGRTNQASRCVFRKVRPVVASEQQSGAIEAEQRANRAAAGW